MLIFGTLLLLPHTAAAGRPCGLMTDLLRNTGTVCIGGYPSDITLNDLPAAVESVQYAEVLSRRPSFGWIVPGERNATRQMAYRIRLYEYGQKSPLWDSGKVDGDRSVAVAYSGRELEPERNYCWQVKVWTNTEGESQWSRLKEFRTGPELADYRTPAEPLRKCAECPVASRVFRGGVFFDFGRAAFGQVVIEARSETGCDTLFVALGEKASDGRVDTLPGGTVRYRRTVLPLLRGTHTYRVKIVPDSRNTQHPSSVKMPGYIGEVLPFRYVEAVSASESAPELRVVRESVTYPFDDMAARFECSDSIINKVWEMCRHTIKATSFTGLYIDGDRERIPYEADILINQLAHYAVDREYTMARRSLEYILERPTWPAEWIMQAVMIAWQDYMHTGDARCLKRNYDMLCRRTLCALRTPSGLISTRAGLQTPEFLRSIRFDGTLKDIVDWPNNNWEDYPGYNGEADGFVFNDYNCVVNAYYYEVLGLMARIADVTGHVRDAGTFRAERAEFGRIFNDTFFDKKKKRYRDGDGTDHSSLHANMFALRFGLVPPQYVGPVVRFVKSRGMACSVYGSQFLLDALFDAGEADYAASLLSSTGERSWYNMIRSGSTVAMEAWDIKYKPNVDWNHAWGAAPANIIPYKLMGVEPLEPGFARMSIKPRSFSLDFARVTLPTIRGEVCVFTRKQPYGYSVSVRIPTNTEGEVYLPCGGDGAKVFCNGTALNPGISGDGYFGPVAVGSGRYDFEIRVRQAGGKTEKH